MNNVITTSKFIIIIFVLRQNEKYLPGLFKFRKKIRDKKSYEEWCKRI